MSLALTGYIKPHQPVVFLVGGEEQRFAGAPADWPTVGEVAGWQGETKQRRQLIAEAEALALKLLALVDELKGME